jgi:hypothetical protein
MRLYFETPEGVGWNCLVALVEERLVEWEMGVR